MKLARLDYQRGKSWILSLLLWQQRELKTDTATGSWTPTGEVFLPVGWYAIGLISDGAPSLMNSTQGNATVQATPLGRKNNYGYGSFVWVAGNYTTGLPATANLTGGTIADAGAVVMHNPWIGLKVI